MNLDADFFRSPLGQLAIVGAVLAVGAGAIWSQHRPIAVLPSIAPRAPISMPKTLTRDGVRVAPKPNVPVHPSAALPALNTPTVATEVSHTLPLTLFAAAPTSKAATKPQSRRAPFGRLIACETVTTLESNRIETPVIGIVTEDLWHAGSLIVPAGAEVHGRAALDRTRERIAVQGQWRIVWRTPDADNGTELAIDGIALDREFDAARGHWGEHDGSAGLRGEIIRTDSDRELRLFAATFLATATAALQDTRTSVGLAGESLVPAITARNATLAGAGAVLREYAQSMREAITRDGFYLRVPSGKSFYLYVTQPLDRDPVPLAGTRDSGKASHEN